MFIGYEIKSNQNQAKGMTLENDIRLTHAVLDPQKKGGKKEPVSLMVEYQGKQFIIAVLDPEKSWQEPLDLMFEADTEVKFFLRGNGSVHLTGYEVMDNDDFAMDGSSSDLDDLEHAFDEDDDDDEADVSAEQPRKKVKKDLQPSTSAGKKAVKANGVEATNGKKKKTANKPPVAGDAADSDEDDDDSDDEDFAELAGFDDDDDQMSDEEMSDDSEEMLDSEELDGDDDSDEE